MPKKQVIEVDSNAILARRHSLDLTLRETAKTSGISISYINQIEQGVYIYISPDKASRLAQALRCDLSDITTTPQIFIPPPRRTDTITDLTDYYSRKELTHSVEFDRARLLLSKWHEELPLLDESLA